MYYSQQCSYCHEVFSVYASDEYKASELLYEIIKKHLIQYGEDDKEYKFDDGKVEDSHEIRQEMKTTTDKIPGSYDQ